MICSTPRLGLARAGALLVAVHHVLDQAQDLLHPGGLGLSVGEGLAPVGDVRLLGHHVEERARHLDANARVAGNALGDLDVVVPAELDPIELHVTTAAQLDGEDELQRRERRNLIEKALDRDLDERLGVFGLLLGGGHSILWSVS